MSFRDLLDTASAQALADHLSPTEISVWERYCREFSTKFHTPLVEVQSMDPLFVVKQVNANNLEDFNAEERLPDLLDMLGSLSDPDYDAKKERAIREEMRGIEEQEAERIKNNEPVHHSLVKDKRVITKEQPPKELPKSGGVNFSYLENYENER